VTTPTAAFRRRLDDLPTRRQSRQPSDQHLRAHVNLFGVLLGNVLQAQEHGRVFKAVERLRKGFIALHKKDDSAKRGALMKFISRLDPELTTHVVRAFSTYFSLVNLAEEAQQHRQRRHMVREGGPLWTGSFHATLEEFQAEGVTPQQLQTLLDRLMYIPVITAHPTEAKRRTLMEALRRIFVTSERLNDPRVGKEQRREITEELQAQIQILWKTDEVRIHKPEVVDEIKNGLYYFREALFGRTRDMRLGSLDLHGSKDVVELVARTPCAIGFSGLGYATGEVRALAISEKKGGVAYVPNIENTISRNYPIARPLYVYTHGAPNEPVRRYLEWIFSDEGQKIVEETGYVPLPPELRNQKVIVQ